MKKYSKDHFLSITVGMGVLSSIISRKEEVPRYFTTYAPAERAESTELLEIQLSLSFII